jgi:hypothetical protein
LQFTSDGGTSLEESRPGTGRRGSSLDRIFKSSPVVQFLSPSARREEEAELARVEEERAEQERLDSELAPLEPVPTSDANEEGDRGANGQERESSDGIMSVSEVPLLRSTASASASASASGKDPGSR